LIDYALVEAKEDFDGTAILFFGAENAILSAGLV